MYAVSDSHWLGNVSFYRRWSSRWSGRIRSLFRRGGPTRVAYASFVVDGPVMTTTTGSGSSPSRVFSCVFRIYRPSRSARVAPGRSTRISIPTESRSVARCRYRFSYSYLRSGFFQYRFRFRSVSRPGGARSGSSLDNARIRCLCRPESFDHGSSSHRRSGQWSWRFRLPARPAARESYGSRSGNGWCGRCL